jgi:hypothetical protein
MRDQLKVTLIMIGAMMMAAGIPLGAKWLLLTTGMVKDWPSIQLPVLCSTHTDIQQPTGRCRLGHTSEYAIVDALP